MLPAEMATPRSLSNMMGKKVRTVVQDAERQSITTPRSQAWG